MATCKNCKRKVQKLTSVYLELPAVVDVNDESDPQGDVVLVPPGHYAMDPEHQRAGFRTRKHRCVR